MTLFQTSIHPSAHERTGLRDHLRKETGRVHQSIEDLWAPHSGFASAEAYRAFLGMLLEVHVTLGLPAAEARMDGSEIAQENARIGALCQDLGVTRPAEAHDAVIGPAFAWGVGYVLNGSAMGAAMMVKGDYLGADWPRGYMRVGQDYVRNGSLKTFFDRLDTLPIDPKAALRGASATFEMFERRSRA